MRRLIRLFFIYVGYGGACSCYLEQDLFKELS